MYIICVMSYVCNLCLTHLIHMARMYITCVMSCMCNLYGADVYNMRDVLRV